MSRRNTDKERIAQKVSAVNDVIQRLSEMGEFAAKTMSEHQMDLILLATNRGKIKIGAIE